MGAIIGTRAPSASRQAMPGKAIASQGGVEAAVAEPDRRKVKGVMADTPTSISRRRGSAPILVNPAYTSQIDSRTGLLQGRRRRDRFYCRDGVVLDADVNAACNIPARLYDEEITLYMPYRAMRAQLADYIKEERASSDR